MEFRYLEKVREKNLVPNFWMSHDYFHAAGFVEREEAGVISVFEGEQRIFPAIGGYCRGYWAGFPTETEENTDEVQFLDYQFIYDPRSFRDLAGHRWKIFRKNINKWKDKGLRWTFIFPGQAINVFLKWMEFASSDEIEDAEVIMKYISDREECLAIVDKNQEIMGVVFSDQNYKFVNFRYCFVLPEDGLSEYVRWRFMELCDFFQPGKMVNDGGSLGSEGLFNFKMKLNPLKVLSVYSSKEDSDES